MDAISLDDPLAQSLDLVEQNVARMRGLFPQAFTENRIDFDVLRQLLGDHVEESPERYGLNWHGKRQARALALQPSTGTLRPCREESVDWDTTGNVIIEGDNLEVLKLLQKGYSGRVKMIYIDPPYNTGNDFVYPDDFRDGIRNYQEQIGHRKDGVLERSNPDRNGSLHTLWLNMMLPRLELAKEMLRDDGVIFVSIDDHEAASLKMLMSDVFGEENFVAQIIWQKVFSPKNTARHFSEDHDYILCFARNAEAFVPNLLPRNEEAENRYQNPDNDSRGPWTSSDLCARNFYSKGTYAVTTPSGRIIAGPPNGRYWTISQERLKELDADNRIAWGPDGSGMPRLKRFLSDVKAGIVPQTLLKYEAVGHTQEAKRDVLSLFTGVESESLFDTPKPVRLLYRLLQLGTSKESIVMDFFAGSGTTAQAVMSMNESDRGSRKYVLVQLPEGLGSPIVLDGSNTLQTIADITRERVRRAGSTIEGPVDTGFRSFKLDTSGIKAWNPGAKVTLDTLEDMIDHVKPDRSDEDVLFELMLKQRFELTARVETRTIAGKAVRKVGDGGLVACLDKLIENGEVEALGRGIAEWVREMSPDGGTTCVFRDTAFRNDVAKTNLTETLRQGGVERVRSL